MMRPFGLASLGAVILALSALFSTGSAINATLIPSARFAKWLLSDDLHPDQVGEAAIDSNPERAVLLLGGITGVFR
jgi:hypothetical protein